MQSDSLVSLQEAGKGSGSKGEDDEEFPFEQERHEHTIIWPVESSRVELSQGKLTSTAATAEDEKTSGAKPPFHPLPKKEEKKKLRPRPKTVLLHVVQVTRPKLLQPSRDASQ